MKLVFYEVPPFLGHSKLEKQAFSGLSDFLFPKCIYFFPDLLILLRGGQDHA
jgi:hypothetical protein